MKYILYIIVIIALFTGCKLNQNEYGYFPFDKISNVNNTIKNTWDVKYKILVIDGCEYIATPSAYQYTSITHKGNCTNSIHIYNKK